jgi:hypothetical protein
MKTIFVLLTLLISYKTVTPTCNVSTKTITDADKLLIVQTHNMYRNQIALQTNTLGTKLPFAKNMRQVYWNDKLAATAQEWANNCNYEHSNQQFRVEPEYEVGENLYISWSTISFQKVDLKKPVDLWYDEISKASRNIADHYTFDSNTGHFTQVVWGNTYQIGCGFSQYQADGRYNTFTVCHYGPAGNIIDLPIYETGTGQACHCPTGLSCGNSVNKGLCCRAGFCDDTTLYGDNSPNTTTSSGTSTSTSTQTPTTSTPSSTTTSTPSSTTSSTSTTTPSGTTNPNTTAGSVNESTNTDIKSNGSYYIMTVTSLILTLALFI